VGTLDLSFLGSETAEKLLSALKDALNVSYFFFFSLLALLSNAWERLCIPEHEAADSAIHIRVGVTDNNCPSILTD
jgi:hypothetical protein